MQIDHSRFEAEGDIGLKHGTERSAGVTGGAPKRVFDMVFSCLAIAMLLPVLLLLIFAVKCISPGPAIFAHCRVGLSGRKFKCFKIRTMYLDAETRLSEHLLLNPSAAHEFQETRKLREDPRVLPVVGNFLRRSSLDEIPQFFNVLLGDMSVVGPRPVTKEEISGYGKNRHVFEKTRPGITGEWQVSGRSNLSWRERVNCDLRYVNNWSMSQDVKIVLQTVAVVLIARGAR